MSLYNPIIIDDDNYPEMVVTNDHYSEDGIQLLFDVDEENQSKVGQRMDMETGMYAPYYMMYQRGVTGKHQVYSTYGFGIVECNALINNGQAKPIPVHMEKQARNVIKLQMSKYKETLESHLSDLKMKLGVYRENQYFTLFKDPTWLMDTHYEPERKYPYNLVPFTKDNLVACTYVMFVGLDNSFQPIESSFFPIKTLASLIEVGRAIPISEDKLRIVEIAEELRKGGHYSRYKEVCYGLCSGARFYNPQTIAYHIAQLEAALK